MQARGRGYESLRSRPNRWRTWPARLGEHAVLVATNAGDPRDARLLRTFPGLRHRAIRFHPFRIRPAEQVAQRETDHGLDLQQQH